METTTEMPTSHGGTSHSPSPQVSTKSTNGTSRSLDPGSTAESSSVPMASEMTTTTASTVTHSSESTLTTLLVTLPTDTTTTTTHFHSTTMETETWTDQGTYLKLTHGASSVFSKDILTKPIPLLTNHLKYNV